MNILFIAYSFCPNVGGVERVTDIIAAGLRKRGHSIYYLCADKNGNCTDARFDVIRMNKPVNEAYDQDSVSIYQRLLTDKHIDVIINQYPSSPKSDFFLIHALPGIRKISFFHGKPFGRVKWEMRTYLRKCKIKPFIGSLLRIVQTRHRFKRFFELSDKVGLLCPGYIDCLAEECGIDRQKAFNIANPSTFDILRPDEISAKDNIILFVGRVSDTGKNVIDFIKVWGLIWDKYPAWKAIIVGDDSGCTAQKQYIESHNIRNIEFVGQQTDVRPFYKRAKINCMTSHTEGWPMVLAEGLSCGCVSCVFNTFESARELVKDRHNGFLIRSYDIQAMADSLSRLMADKELTDNMAKAALKRAEQFTIDKIIDAWEMILK